MNVKFPSGLVVNNVPDDITKSELTSMMLKNGYTPEQLGIDISSVQTKTKEPEDKSSILYAAEHPLESFGELGKDALLGVVGTRDKADWQHPLNYLSPWASTSELSKDDVENAETLQKVGDVGLSMAAYMSGAGAADALLAPIAGESTLASVGTSLASNTSGSLLSQASDGDVSLKQTVKDALLGSALEGVGEYILKPGAKQVKYLYDRMKPSIENEVTTNVLTEDYLNASRSYDLAKDYSKLKAKNPNATLLDAYQNLYEQSPELYTSGRIEGIKNNIKHYKNSVDPNVLKEEMLDLKNWKAQELKDQLKTTSSNNKLLRTAKNNQDYKGNILTGKMVLDNNTVDSTPFQRLGDFLGKNFGYTDELNSMFKGKYSTNTIKKDVEKLISDLYSDIEKVKEKKINITSSGKKGTHINSHKTALNYQIAQNYKMIDFLDSLNKGKKIPINDFALAIKNVQEKEFGNVNLTKRFRDLVERFEQMNLTKNQEELDELKKAVVKVGKAAVKTYGYAGATVLTGPLGIMTAAGATFAGRLSQRFKSKALNDAYQVFKKVESGEWTEKEAENFLKKKISQRGTTAKVVNSVVRSSRQSTQDKQN
ncbi:hypothetical protein QUQ16_000190 [Escherichia coli]|nr:hypothetical protein [Escherichia coli]